MLDQPDGNVIARGSYFGGPDYEFVVAANGGVYFRVVGDADMVWAGRNKESFRSIAYAWNHYRVEVLQLTTEEAKLQRVTQLRREFTELGALPDDLPSDPEPLWSLLISEAEFGLT